MAAYIGIPIYTAYLRAEAERLLEQNKDKIEQMMREKELEDSRNSVGSIRLDVYNKYREASGRNISFDDLNAGMQNPEMRRKVLNYTKNRLGNLGYEIGDLDKAFSNY